MAACPSSVAAPPPRHRRQRLALASLILLLAAGETPTANSEASQDESRSSHAVLLSSDAFEQATVCHGIKRVQDHAEPDWLKFRCGGPILDGHGAYRFLVPEITVPPREYGGFHQGVDLKIRVVRVYSLLGRSCKDGHVRCEDKAGRFQALLGYGSSWTPFNGCGGAQQTSIGTEMALSLMCFPTVGPNLYDANMQSRHLQASRNLPLPPLDAHNTNMTVSVLPSVPVYVDMTLDLKTYWLNSSTRGQTQTGYIGGDRLGKSRMFAIMIPDDGADYERIKIAATVMENTSDRVVYNAYVINENDCITPRINSGGCTAPREIIECLNVNRLSFTAFTKKERRRMGQHASFLSDITMTLSRASEPPRAPGRWFILLTCGKDLCTDNCPLTKLTVQHHSEFHAEMDLLKGAAMMFLASIAFLTAINVLVVLAYRLLGIYGTVSEEAKHLWPAFSGRPTRAFCAEAFRNAQENLRNPSPFLATLMALMLGVFIATAGQFVVTHWYLMERTGDRDVCFYNEDCYYPFRGSSIPWNHMLSHIPYFVVGFHLVIQASYAEHTIRSYNETGEGKRKLNLRAFYGLAASFMAEGVGSACYHVCPSVETFQFDTCFMIPIAHLCCLVLADWPEKSAKYALTYFLMIVTPIWIFCFIGTWYDIKVAQLIGDGDVAYKVFCVAMTLWAIAAVQSFDFLLRDRDSENPSCVKWLRLTLKVIVVLVVGASSKPAVRGALGGTANCFLLLSILVMICVNSWQIYILELRHQRCGPFLFINLVIKYSYLMVMGFVSALGLWCFQDKVVIVAPGVSAAESHEANKPCLAGTVFDLHDSWHFLSAISLALTAMLLLDVKVNSHLHRDRGVALFVDFEDEDEDSDSDDEDDAGSI